MMSPMQRGYAAVQAQDIEEAADWFERAAQEDPANPAAQAWLGQCLCALGETLKGTGHLREAGRQLLARARTDGDVTELLEITAQLQRWNDFPGALELGQQAVAIDAGEFRGFQLLAVTCSQLNRKSDALAAARRALELAPDHPMMQVLMASLEADAGLNEDAKRRLERCLGEGLEPREEFRARKELARVLDKRREYDRVFEHLHASARLGRSLPEYAAQDQTLVPGVLRANKAGFDRDLLGRWSGAAFPPERPAPTFLIGFFRSGTTLTQEVLGVHPDVFVADESDFVWAMHRELHEMVPAGGSTAEKLRRLDLPGIRRLRDCYWERARQRVGANVDRPLFLDKFTMNTIDVGLINAVFPDARVVFVMRDPRDVCLSCFMQLMVPTPATVHMLTWQGTADLYAQVMDWWMHVRQRLTLPFFEFRYEDAVTQFESTYRKVFDFLGLTWDPRVAEFHEHAARKFIASPSRTQVAQPLYATSVARWRHYEAEFTPVADRLRPFVEAFEYEPF